MNKFLINQKLISELFWTTLTQRITEAPDRDLNFLTEYHDTSELLRASADYNTGSISKYSMLLLYEIAKIFSPVTIAEIGTFIGRSTVALGRGALSGKNAKNSILYTCDYSNDIVLPKVDTCIIRQFRKIGSEDMLNAIRADQKKIDLLFIDGRLSDADLKILESVLDQHSIIVFDDFEGIEKGVINFLALKQLKRKDLLIYPPQRGSIDSISFRGSSTLALSLPLARLGFVNQ